MRIAFDGTALRPLRTGVGYYTEHLLHHLAQEASGDELLVISNRPVDTAVPLPGHVRVVTAGYYVPKMVWIQTGAVRTLERVGADVVHFTNGMVPLASRKPTVVTIHDMSLRLYARYHPPRRVLLNRPLVDYAARRADAVITVSASAKHDIVSLYKLDPDRVQVIHEAAAPLFRRICDPDRLERVRRQYSLAERIILYVGTIEPRKNLPRLIEAFAAHHRSGDLPHQLVCVGPYGWRSRGLDDDIRRSRVGSAINFVGYVPIEHLPVLYSLAEMFVYPSMYEGFGLPVVEAMACGVPVITGRTAALAEVGGDAVVQVDRLDGASLGEAMVRLASDGDLRRRLAQRGLQRATSFSWRRAARETLEVYRRVAAPSARRTAAPRPLTSSTGLTRAAARSTAAATVLFGQAYFLRFDPKQWAARQPYAPLGTLYAAACARAAGYRVTLFDAMLAASEEEWSAALDRERPEFAVIYEDNFNYLSKMCLSRMRQAALVMIAAARARNIPTIVAGSDASDHAVAYLDGGAAAVIVGEGETTLVEVLDSLSGRTSRQLEEIDGVCVYDQRRQLRRTPARAVIRDVDSFPFPAWDLVDVARYKDIWLRHHGYYSMNVVTARGCPFHCNWCAKPIYGQRYNVRSPDNVVDELAWLKRTHAPDHVWIADDIFGLKPGWIERFACLVNERGATIPFKCLVRADQVTPAVAAALRVSGCETAWIGAESGSQRILDAMEKGISVEQIHTATRLLHEAGIDVGFFLQFGYPGEVREDIDKTIEMMRACRPDDIGVSVSYPLPGTPFFERVKAQLGEKRNWVDSNDLALMYRGTFVPDFYRTLHALVHAEFRAQRFGNELKKAVGNPRTIRPRHFGRALASLSYRLKVPLLKSRADRQAKILPSAPPIVVLPVLTPQAAAIPSDQPHLT
jgi:anaerobic magnesium-protoporphyrin IX monomethyl ester cyclase